MKQRINALKASILNRRTIKLPHERDETVDPIQPPAQPIIVQAARDLARGLVDTGRSAAVDITYKKLKRTSS